MAFSTGGQGTATAYTVPTRQLSERRPAVVARASFKDVRQGLTKFLDSVAFENWAPRSSRTWRLPPQKSEGRLAAELEDEAQLEVLNRRLAAAAEERGRLREASSEASSSSEGVSLPEALNDSDLALSLNRRIAEMGGPVAVPAALSGGQLRKWIEDKYGKSYDLSVVRRQLPAALGGKTIVALNVMWTHLSQQSFPMSEEEYLAKLDNIAMSLTAWGQSEVVREFFLAPAKSKNGLPGRRPVVGNAISLRLNLPDNIIQEWFGA